MERLANPEVAAHYLNATMEHSPDQLLAALKNVAQARQMVKVAKDAGVQRETLYRSLAEGGNPTLETLTSVLSAVGLRLAFAVEGYSQAGRANGLRTGVDAPDELVIEDR
jgi:probable addiction module antidote protein